MTDSKMTSIFATFRRPKKKDSLSGGDSFSPTTPKTSNRFSSTPNLAKIDYKNRIHPKNKVLVDTNINSSSSSTTSATGWGGFEYRRTSMSTTTMGPPPPPVGTTTSLKKSSGGGSIRNFMSMAGLMGSLKRSKSIRKLGWGSTLNVASPPVSKDSSPGPPAAKSAEFLDRGDSSSISSSSSRRLHANKPWLAKSSPNTEPGVASSGESSSENSSLQDATSIRASSERYSEYGSDFEDEVAPKDPEEQERNKNILIGTKKFNMEAKKGIEFLVEKGILEFTAEDVARFIKDGYGLSKASIGTYLGERIDFNEAVLKAFVDLHDFKNLILVQALRQFLWAFRLPGESQKISRILDTFAERYCRNNPNLFSTDTCSVLCYSIIMLNTELHNPNVKDKVSLEQFIRRNRGIEGGEGFTDKDMTSLYNSILSEPFRFPEEDGNDLMLTFFNPDYEGWLYKFGGRPKSWKRLWFILSNNCLYYFKFTTDKTPLGIIPLENILVEVPPEKPASKQKAFILYKESPDPTIVDLIKTCKTLPGGQTVPRLYNSIQLGTPDWKEREHWVRAINANHSMSPFYWELAEKKNKARDLTRKNTSDSKGASLSTSSSTIPRKSQISLPSSTFTSTPDMPPPPVEVLLNPNKDPNNFFAAKNLSAISLVNPDRLEITDDPRTRSKSEGRLYGTSRKGSLERGPSSALSVEMRSRSNSRSPLFRDKNRHDKHNVADSMESSSQFYVPSQHVTSTTTDSPVQLRREISAATPTQTIPPPAIYDKYKKLSMINELCARSGSISSSSSSSDDYFHAKRKTSIVVVTDPPATTTTTTPTPCDTPSPIIPSIPRPSSSSSSSDESDSSGGGGGGDDDAHTEFEYRVLTSDQDDGAGDLSTSRTNLLSKSQDFLEDPNSDQIQIIDCSKAHIRTKSVDLVCSDDDDEDKVTKRHGCDLFDTDFYENPQGQIYFQNSIYESNV